MLDQAPAEGAIVRHLRVSTARGGTTQPRESMPVLKEGNSMGATRQGRRSVKEPSAAAIGIFRLILAAAFIAVVWQVLRNTSPVAARYLLPSFRELGTTVHDLAVTGLLWTYIYDTLSSILLSFTLATVTAVPLGLLMARIRLVDLLLEPVIELIRPVSPVAWIPLAVLWFGIGDASRIFIGWLLAFFVIIINVYAGASSIEKNLLDAARTLGTSRKKMFTKVIFPASLPSTITAMRLGLQMAFGGIVIAEMISAQSGIGYMMDRARTVIDPGQLVLGMILLGTIGFAINAGLVAVQNWVAPLERTRS